MLSAVEAMKLLWWDSKAGGSLCYCSCCCGPAGQGPSWAEWATDLGRSSWPDGRRKQLTFWQPAVCARFGGCSWQTPTTTAGR